MRPGRRAAVAAALFVVGGIQLVPYGRAHENPPVEVDAPWPNDDVRALAVAACYDCHSNETDWPWYSNVAPMSWLTQRDVERGRDELNFSEWDGDPEHADDEIEDGSMPPRQYTWMHPDARLSDREKEELLVALEAMEEAGEAEEEAAEEAEDGADNSGPGSANSGRGRGRSGG